MKILNLVTGRDGGEQPVENYRVIRAPAQRLPFADAAPQNPAPRREVRRSDSRPAHLVLCGGAVDVEAPDTREGRNQLRETIQQLTISESERNRLLDEIAIVSLGR